MKPVRIIFHLIAAPLIATLLVALITLIEPGLRTILVFRKQSWARRSPNLLTMVSSLLRFGFLHLAFLGLIRLFGRLGYARKNMNSFIFAYSVLMALLAAFVFHAPQTGELFYQTFFVMLLLMGFLIYVGELISRKLFILKEI